MLNRLSASLRLSSFHLNAATSSHKTCCGMTPPVVYILGYIFIDVKLLSSTGLLQSIASSSLRWCLSLKAFPCETVMAEAKIICLIISRAISEHHWR